MVFSRYSLFSSCGKEWKQCLQFCTSSIRKSPQTGIVLLNMGGPQSTDEVHDYLFKIMTDRDMIQFPFMQKVNLFLEYPLADSFPKAPISTLGPWIAKRRTAAVQKKYEEIGGGSPIYKWTKKQGELLCAQLDQQSPATAPHKYYVSFRYCKPTTEDAFSKLEEQLPNGLKFSIIDRWATHPLLVKTFADLIRKELQKFSDEKRKQAIVLFSAHSLPLKAVNRGDSYPSEVAATVQLVMQELGHCNPYQLVWQSKVGPLPWLGPFTDEALKGYVAQGKKTFVVVPIAFVNEHIETLHELDIEYCTDLAKELKLNLEDIRRVPAPNDHPLFIDALTDLVKSHLEGDVPVGKKFLNRCPHCINANCYHSKKWFLKVCTI